MEEDAPVVKWYAIYYVPCRHPPPRRKGRTALEDLSRVGFSRRAVPSRAIELPCAAACAIWITIWSTFDSEPREMVVSCLQGSS